MDYFDYIGAAGILVWISSVFMVTQLFLGLKLTDLSSLLQFITTAFDSTLTSIEQ